MSERWLPVVGFASHEVSDQGRVRRVDSARGFLAGHVLTTTPEPKGYHRVMVRHDHRRHLVRVHIAVLEAFVGPRPPRHDASHLNGVRADNRLENLCWETSSDNHQRKLAHGTLVHGEKHKCSKLKVEQVRNIRRRVAAGELRKELAREFGVSGTLVGKIAAGKAWMHAA